MDVPLYYSVNKIWQGNSVETAVIGSGVVWSIPADANNPELPKRLVLPLFRTGLICSKNYQQEKRYYQKF